ncbi:MAG: MATE family efflux transporter [Anaerobacillus sp.]|uniref:MATE family efflux transporter n=1 Tax=Anaerobacillus sp. TaxID=1872506 RepID=UPI00391B578B
MIETIAEKKQFYRNMLAFAIPITIQTLITSSLNMVDSVMVGQLGVESIAAVGLANKINTMLIIILQGFATGAAIFSAQYWGKGDKTGISKVLMITFAIISSVSLLSMILVVFNSNSIIGIFSDNSSVIVLGASYIKLISFSYLFTGLTILIQVVLRSMGEVKSPMYINIFVIVLNTVLNYIFIFGNFGAPALGVEGAALATVFARVIQTMLLFLLIQKFGILTELKRLTAKEIFDVTLIKNYLTISIPSVINHVVWTVGEMTFFWMYSLMGTDVIAAITLIDPLVFIFMATFIGISDASSIMVGNRIGASQKERAYLYSRRFLFLTFILSICAAFGVILVSPLFISLYKVTDTVAGYASSVLLIYALIISPKFLNMVNNMGVLRAGGDTKYVLYLDLLGVWLVGLPLAALGIYLKLPLYIVFALGNSHELVRLFFGIRRTLTKKWLNEITNTTEKKIDSHY